MKKILGILFVLLLSAGAFAETHVWDVLRPETQIAEAYDVPVKVIVFTLSVIVFAISFMAYKRSGSKRILLVSLAFLLFVLKWAIKILDAFYSPGNFLSDASESVFELGIILLLLVALFYRKSWGKFFEKDSSK